MDTNKYYTDDLVDQILLKDIITYTRTNKYYLLEKYACEKLKENNLTTWSVKWYNVTSYYGQCHYKNKHIKLSIPHTKNNSLDFMKTTILHEISHALTPGHKHDLVWKKQCLKLGMKPEDCKSRKKAEVQIVGKYAVKHKDTGEIFNYYNKKSNRDWSKAYIPKRKKETIGKLIFVEM